MVPTGREIVEERISRLHEEARRAAVARAAERTRRRKARRAVGIRLVAVGLRLLEEA